MLKSFIREFFVSKKFEAFRYLIVGGSCSLGHIIFLWFLTDIIGIFYLYSTVISFIIISFIGYFGQKYFTYRNFEKEHKRQLMLYWTVIFIGLGMDASLMYSFVSLIGIYYVYAGIITRFVIFVMNFLWGKFITFKESEKIISEVIPESVENSSI